MKKLLSVAVFSIVGAIIACSDAKFPYLVSIQVSPGNPSVAAGLTEQFTAQGTFSNGATRDLTPYVAWTSSTQSVASIAKGGLATTYSQGASTISAVFTQPSGTVTGSTTLTVGAPTLVSIAITDISAATPGQISLQAAKIAVGTTHQFFAYGTYTDGGIRDITSAVTWSSSPVTVATISAGRAKGVSPGAATITATDPTTTIAESATLNVTNATVTTIVVSPANQTIAPVTGVVFSALGEFSDGTTQDVTADANWSSTNTAAATVTKYSNVSGVAAGTTTINAAFEDVTGSTALTVSSASPVSITLTPSSSGVAIGSTFRLQLVRALSDGTTQGIASLAVWSVSPSDGSIATVSGGLVTGVAAGTATVTAQFGTVTKTATITVENVSSLAITPASATIAEGTATPLDVVATLADGSTQDVTSSVTWLSTNPAIALVSNVSGAPGWVAGLAPGSDTISAVLDGQSAQAQLTVTNATLTAIAITPTAAQNIALGKGQQYKATATFSDSSTQDLTNQVAWTSSDPAVAVMNRFGFASTTGTGSTMVKAVANINGVTQSDSKVLTIF